MTNNPSTWTRIPTNRGLRDDYPEDVFGIDDTGGATEAVDVDLVTKKGAVTARKGESLVSVPPFGECLHGIEQRHNSIDGTTPYAALIGDGEQVTGLAVKGFKDFDGHAVVSPDRNHGLDPANGWYVSPGETKDAPEHCTLDHQGSEVRLDGSTPLYFGLPAEVKRRTEDWRLWDATTEIPEFIINGPFGEENEIRAPKTGEVYVSFYNNSGIGAYNNEGDTDAPGFPLMWGTQSYTPKRGKYTYAYFGASYVYAGGQESPLWICPERGEYDHYGTTFYFWRSILADVFFPGVVISTTGSRVSIPRRVRKIRFYCAPSEVEVAEPRSQLQFYLVSEIDVSKGDQDSPVRRYNLTGYLRNEVINGVSRQIVSIPADTGLVNKSSVDADPDGHPYLPFGSYIKVGDSKNVYRIIGHVTQSDDANQDLPKRWIKVWVDSGDHDALASDFRERGVNDTAQVAFTYKFRAFADSSIPGLSNPQIRVFIGDELLARSNYSEMSGLSQTLTDSVSPPRGGGVMVGGRKFIWGTQDKDHKLWTNRIEWSGFNPQALPTQDIFPPENYSDGCEFPVETIVGVGPDLAIFGQNCIKYASIGGREEGQWRWLDSLYGVGCVAPGTVCSTPIGVLFLGSNGVQVLVGNELHAVPVSEPIRNRLAALETEWPKAHGRYSSRRHHYILIFPVSGTTLVYDLTVKAWLSFLLTGPTGFKAAGMGTDVNGNVLVCSRDGVYEVGSSSAVNSGQVSSYAVRHVFGDTRLQKKLIGLQVYFDGPMQTTISVDGGAPLQVDLINGVYFDSLGLTGMAFDFRFWGFTALKSVEVYAEHVERQGL
jgi:hypothetical protein